MTGVEASEFISVCRRLQLQPRIRCDVLPTHPVFLKNPYRHLTYQGNIRDKMRVTFGVRSVVAKDTVSVLVKVAREMDKSASEVGNGIVSHPTTSSRDRRLLPHAAMSTACARLAT